MPSQASQASVRSSRPIGGASEGEEDENKADFPPGWDEKRVQRVLGHYEPQTEEEAVAEDEAAFEDSARTVMEISNELVPSVRELLAKRAG